MQCCKGVRDVVITTQSIHQTSRGVQLQNRLEVPLLISRKHDQDKIATVESCDKFARSAPQVCTLEATWSYSHTVLTQDVHWNSAC